MSSNIIKSIHPSISTRIHTHLHARTHACMHAHTHSHTHTHMHTCIHTHMHTCIHTHTHTHTIFFFTSTDTTKTVACIYIYKPIISDLKLKHQNVCLIKHAKFNNMIYIFHLDPIGLQSDFCWGRVYVSFTWHIFSLLQKANLRQPVRQWSDADLDKMKMRYYSPEVHVAAFALPFHIKKVRHG